MNKIIKIFLLLFSILIFNIIAFGIALPRAISYNSDLIVLLGIFIIPVVTVWIDLLVLKILIQEVQK